jgi:hypothetical protein
MPASMLKFRIGAADREGDGEQAAFFGYRVTERNEYGDRAQQSS